MKRGQLEQQDKQGRLEEPARKDPLELQGPQVKKDQWDQQELRGKLVRLEQREPQGRMAQLVQQEQPARMALRDLPVLRVLLARMAQPVPLEQPARMALQVQQERLGLQAPLVKQDPRVQQELREIWARPGLREPQGLRDKMAQLVQQELQE